MTGAQFAAIFILGGVATVTGLLICMSRRRWLMFASGCIVLGLQVACVSYAALVAQVWR